MEVRKIRRIAQIASAGLGMVALSTPAVELVDGLRVTSKPAARSSPTYAATAEALIAFCRERLLKWSCPREIEFRRELPKSFVGKVLRRVLVDEETLPKV